MQVWSIPQSWHPFGKKNRCTLSHLLMYARSLETYNIVVFENWSDISVMHVYQETGRFSIEVTATKNG